MSCSDANYGRLGPSAPCLDFGGLENREQKVGSYAANGYGLYDMDGNVMEWVNDLYSADYYVGRPEPDNNPPGPVKDDANYIIHHVVRGGCWASISPLLLSVSFRDIESHFTYGEIGFRCAADPPPPEGE